MADLTKYSSKELGELKEQIDKELSSRRKGEAKQAQKELKKVAEKYGFNLNELVGATKPKQRTTGAIKYRHPEDATKTWSGRGRKPAWVKDWEQAGRPLQDAKVA